MQRYSLDKGYKDGVKVVGIREDDNGPYVLYADARAEIDRLVKDYSGINSEKAMTNSALIDQYRDAAAKAISETQKAQAEIEWMTAEKNLLFDNGVEKGKEIDRLTKENKILAIKCESSLANNLCPDHRDKQAGKPCLACEIDRLKSQLAAMKALDPDTISDGFGLTCSVVCPQCGKRTMEVVRPGKVQCSNCG